MKLLKGFFIVFTLIMYYVNSTVFIFGLPKGEVRYYANYNYYEQVNAQIVKIHYSEDSKEIYLILDFYSPNMYLKTYFKINEANSKIAIYNQFNEDLKPGDYIMVRTTPLYFGDGYPIVSISGEKSYLDFETGVKNLVSESKAKKESFIRTFSITMSILMFFLISSLILMKISKNHSYYKRRVY